MYAVSIVHLNETMENTFVCVENIYIFTGSHLHTLHNERTPWLVPVRFSHPALNTEERVELWYIGSPSYEEMNSTSTKAGLTQAFSGEYQPGIGPKFL